MGPSPPFPFSFSLKVAYHLLPWLDHVENPDLIPPPLTFCIDSQIDCFSLPFFFPS